MPTRPRPPRPCARTLQAVWYLPDAPEGTLSPPGLVRLRSVHSKEASVIRFANTSSRAVRALWLDFDGHEVRMALARARCAVLCGSMPLACTACAWHQAASDCGHACWHDMHMIR